VDSTNDIDVGRGFLYNCFCIAGFFGTGRNKTTNGAGCTEEATISSALVNPIEAGAVVFELKSTAGIYAKTLLILSPGEVNEEIVEVQFLGRINTSRTRRNTNQSVDIVDTDTHLTLVGPTTKKHSADAQVTRNGTADLLSLITGRRNGNNNKTSSGKVAGAVIGALFFVTVLVAGAAYVKKTKGSAKISPLVFKTANGKAQLTTSMRWLVDQEQGHGSTAE
jgi:hypothetical protein